MHKQAVFPMAFRTVFAVMVAQASALASSSLLAQEKPGTAKENPMCMGGHVAPSVFLMGYQKSGSTSLWNDLKDNYNLGVAKALDGEDGFREKEVAYFNNDQRYAKGKNFYLKHFPKCNQMKTGAVMDASPNTVFGGEKTALRVKDLYGDKAKDLKFIIIARDPTSRMESAYWHFNAGLDNNFDGYVAKTIAKAQAWMNDNGTAPEPNLYYPNMYVKHLKPWFEHFDADQFAFITLQQYNKEHGAAMRHLQRRLKIKGRQGVPAYENHKRDHPDMSPKTRKLLESFFKPSLKELEELVQEKKIGLGPNPVAKEMSLLQTDAEAQTSMSSTMDEDTEEALRMEYGSFEPAAATSELQMTSELDEEIGGPMDFEETNKEPMSATDIDFELRGDALHP